MTDTKRALDQIKIQKAELDAQIASLQKLADELDSTINAAIRDGSCILGVYMLPEGEYAITIKAEKCP